MKTGRIRVINIDWLEVYGLESIPLTPEYFTSKGYKVEVRSFGTPQYSQMFTLKKDGYDLFEVRRLPYSIKSMGGIFMDGSCHIRLTNFACYFKNPVNLIREFFASHHIQYRSISRIDICMDFNSFDDADMPCPKDFVKRYMRGDISKVNQNRMAAHGIDRWDGRDINSLKWGSQSSPNTTKLYNKSLELRQSGGKPYIEQCWLEGGLDLSKDVWRIEFSMTSQFQTLKNKKTGELVKKDLSSYDTKEKILDQFRYLYAKYFDFRQVMLTGKGTYMRKYDCPRISNFYFSAHDVAFEPKRNPTEQKKPSRTLTILTNLLMKMMDETEIPTYILEPIQKVLSFLIERMNVYKRFEEVEQRKKVLSYIERPIEIPMQMLVESELTSAFNSKYIKDKIERSEKLILNKLIKKYNLHLQPVGCPF